MLPIRTILLPTDSSDCSEHARQVARSLCSDLGARLIVLHVASTQVACDGPSDGSNGARPDLKAIETRLREDFKDSLDARAEIHVREGGATAAIIAIADEVGVDLIVMGATGGTGCGTLRLGSVAEEVIRKAHCPVLTVRGPAVPEAPETSTPSEAKREEHASWSRGTQPLRA